MKLKEGYRLREVAGQYMLVPSGPGTVDMNSVFSLSESAAWLWKALQGRDFSKESAVSLLEGEYEVDRDTASKDVATLFGIWKENGLIDE